MFIFIRIFFITVCSLYYLVGFKVFTCIYFRYTVMYRRYNFLSLGKENKVWLSWQRAAWFRAFQDSAQLDSVISRTARSLIQGFPGQRAAWFSAFPDSTQLDSRLSRTARSLIQGFPGKCAAWFRAFPDSVQLDSGLSRKVRSLIQGFPGKRWI